MNSAIDGFAWCEEAVHIVEEGESGAVSEPCWISGTVCTLRNAIDSTNRCPTPQTLELVTDGNYVFDKSDSTWASDVLDYPEEEVAGGGLPVNRIVDRIENDLSIVGNNANLSIAAGVRKLWFFEVAPGINFVIDNVTISGSDRALRCTTAINTHSGSAVLNRGNTTIRNSTLLRHNTCRRGAAILSFGELLIERSTIRNSRSDFGAAAIYAGTRLVAEPVATLIVISSQINDNIGVSAVTCAGSDCKIAFSTFFQNFSTRSTIMMTPGAAATNANLNITSSTISNNTAEKSGGIEQCDGRLSLQDVTVADNSGAEASAIALGCSGSIQISNTAISAPFGTSACAVIVSESFTTVDGMANDSSCPGMRTVPDLQLGPIGPHGGSTPTRLPDSGSPLIDSGTACHAQDQRSRVRPLGLACDVGAVEVR